MDVAEIRKKAKTAKAPRLPSDGETLLRPLPVMQGAPVSLAPPELLMPMVCEDIGDPLDEFFSATLDMMPSADTTPSQEVSAGPAKEEEASRQYLTFSLGTEEYALDIADIREIIKPREITDIPRVPEFILGIISLRGIILPVFDLKRRLKLGTIGMTTLSRIVVCQLEDRIVGLLVDSITQVVRLPADRIEPPPAVLSGMDRDLVEGVGRHEGRMMILLHLPCVMNAELV